jgi:hypothetical protein
MTDPVAVNNSVNSFIGGGLANYSAVNSHLLIKIVVPYYRLNPTDSPVYKVLTFSDMNLNYSVTLDGNEYKGLGGFLNITASRSELTPTSNELSISLSGIPNSSIYQIVNSRIKGCEVAVYRAFFDPVTGSNLLVNNGGNVFTRFQGFVNNYSLSENYSVTDRRSDNTLTLICKTAIDVMANKVTGRLTNSVSQKKYFPNDLSMDRVSALQGTSYNFGAPL